MSKIFILDSGFSWKIKVDGATTHQVQSLNSAKNFAIDLAIEMDEEIVEVYDKTKTLIETIEV